MITTINEFKFSNHYTKDNDSRFESRIKRAKIVNTDIDNLDKANERFKKALYYIGLEKMDQLNLETGLIGVVFGNIYFKENKRLKPAIVEIDNKRQGNVYVAIVKNNKLITIILLPMTYSNSSIVDKIKEHERREGIKNNTEPDKVNNLYDLNGNVLDLNSSKRRPITIDLDMKEDEFNKLYPYSILKNNSIHDINGLTDFYKDEVSKKTAREDTEFVYTPTVGKIPLEEKEFVIYKGMNILFKTDNNKEPELKQIYDIIVTEYGNRIKYELQFEGFINKYEIKPGDNFIITPKIQNKQYKELIDMFDLEDGKEISFSGPIVKFMSYKKGKGGSDRFKLGVIIKPNFVL